MILNFGAKSLIYESINHKSLYKKIFLAINDSHKLSSLLLTTVFRNNKGEGEGVLSMHYKYYRRFTWFSRPTTIVWSSSSYSRLHRLPSLPKDAFIDLDVEG